MYIIQQTEIFEKWLSKLKDKRDKAKVLVRLKRAEMGNLGDGDQVIVKYGFLRVRAIGFISPSENGF